jgi:hypothetical protein
MSAKIKLVTYGTARNIMPSLQGRSGRVYDRAHFNEKDMRHQTAEFDLDEFQNTILPDIAKHPNKMQWWQITDIGEPSDDVKRLTEELSAAKSENARLKAEIARLKSEQTNTRTPDAFTGLVNATGANEPAAQAARPLTELAHRELRAMMKERGIPLIGNPNKDDMIALLSAPKPDAAPADDIET